MFRIKRKKINLNNQSKIFQREKMNLTSLKDPKKIKIELKGHDKTKRINSLVFTKVYKPSSATAPSSTTQS